MAAYATEPKTPAPPVPDDHADMVVLRDKRWFHQVLK
jgi:hypothetical protein